MPTSIATLPVDITITRSAKDTGAQRNLYAVESWNLPSTYMNVFAHLHEVRYFCAFTHRTFTVPQYTNTRPLRHRRSPQLEVFMCLRM